MATFIAIYLLLGFAIFAALVVWIVVDSVRTMGVRQAVRAAGRELAHDLSLSWRLPWAAGTFLVGIPFLGAWCALNGSLDAAQAVGLAIVWLLWLAVLRWHLRARKRQAN